jgi:uncharacterized protein (TIGR03437 family)
MGRTQGYLKRLVVFAAVACAASAQTPTVAQGGVINAANGISPITPGSLVSIYGTNLAAGLAQADSATWSSQLNNVSVTLNGIAAPLWFVSGNQINAQVPWNVLTSGTSGSANVVVTNNGKPSAPQTVQVGPFSPGIFAIGPTGTIAVAINNNDGTIAAPVGSIPGVATRPAGIGEPLGLQIWCTGLGAVDSSIANGAPSSDKLRNATTLPIVTVGGKQVTVLFAGLQPNVPGVNQINITLPAGTPTGNAVPLQITTGGITTSTTITIAVQ